MKEKKAEIVDSAPDNQRDSDRMFLATYVAVKCGLILSC